MQSVGIARPGVVFRGVGRLRAQETPEKEKIKLQRGFRWDPALQRWIEETRNEGKEFRPEDMMIKTKTGDEYTVWPVVHAYLVDSNIQSVKVNEIEGLMKEGYTLLDVRLKKDFDKGHAKGAVNVPLFQPVSKEDTWSQIKKVVSTLMAMTPTGDNIFFVRVRYFCQERNKNFAKEVAEAVPEKSKIIVMCSRGGTLETIIVGPGENPKTCKDPDRAFGRETRSLKAIYELLQDGFNDLVYVEGGVGQWVYDGMEVETSK